MIRNNSEGKLIERNCTECGEIKSAEHFNRKSSIKNGHRSICRECQSTKRANHYANNSGKEAEGFRRWYENNRVKDNERCSEWSHNNLDRRKLSEQKRRSRKSELPDNLTPEAYSSVLRTFGGACALSGEPVGANVHIEHFIALATGHGGTTDRNCYPLRADMNLSKSASNPFIWYERNADRFEIDSVKWDALVEHLANQNRMTVPEYREYVYECYS